MAPSTEWREQIAADEDARYGRYAEQFAALQARNSAKAGDGRALHRKQLLALNASFDVLPDLPAHARQGLCATPGPHRAVVRLSNGGAVARADLRPDIRGFALKIFDVSGPAAMGGEATSQDFLMINHEIFSFSTSDEFVSLALAASAGGGALVKYLFKRYGLFGTFKTMRKLGKTINAPFSGFATERVSTAAPLAWGPYAVKVRMVPRGTNAVNADAKNDWAADIKARLAKEALSWDFQVQFFESEATTPIENPSVAWPSPWVTVGRLTIPVQSFDDAALDAKIEKTKFDPWNALMAHRPLGDVMRARKASYFASQKARHAE